MKISSLHSKGCMASSSSICMSFKVVGLVFYTSAFLLLSSSEIKAQEKIVENEEFISNHKYLDNDAIGALFSDLQRQYPHLARAYSIGKTVENRDINVLSLSAPGDSIVGNLLKPTVKVVANIHGDEAVGRQIVLYMAQYLLLNYANVPELQQLLNNTEIHFMPSCNPDGFEAAKVSSTYVHAYGSCMIICGVNRG